MPSPIDNAIHQISRLPGIGEKTATKLIYWLIAQEPDVCLEIGGSICELPSKISRCTTCFSLSESETCDICSDSNRQKNIVCVVETPRDIDVIEATGEFEGRYHVLDGVISPQRGIEAQHLRIRELLERLRDTDIEELFIATNPNLEGDLTAAYIAQAFRGLDVKITRLAGGVPAGAELEYTNATTIARAILHRHEI